MTAGSGCCSPGAPAHGTRAAAAERLAAGPEAAAWWAGRPRPGRGREPQPGWRTGPRRDGAGRRLPTARASMPLLAATVLRRGRARAGTPGSTGDGGRPAGGRPAARAPGRRLPGCHPAGRPAGAGAGAAAVRRPRRHRPDRGGGLAPGRGGPQPGRADGARLPPGAGDRHPGRPRRRLPRRHRRLHRRRGAAPRDRGLAGGRGRIRQFPRYRVYIIRRPLVPSRDRAASESR